MNAPDLSEVLADPDETFDLESLFAAAEQLADDEEISLLDAFRSELTRRGGWVVDDAASAEWAMAKARAATHRIERDEAQAQEWASKISEWLTAATRRDRATVEFMGELLKRYAIEQRKLSDDRTKTIVLPSGKITTNRAKAATVVVEDSKAVVEWVDTLDRSVAEAMTTRTVRLTELRQYVHIKDGVVYSLDAERVPGVKVQEPTTTAKVVVGE